MVPITHRSRILFAAKHEHKHEHEQTIICRQLFAGHLVGSRPNQRKKHASNEKQFYFAPSGIFRQGTVSFTSNKSHVQRLQELKRLEFKILGGYHDCVNINSLDKRRHFRQMILSHMDGNLSSLN